MDTVLSIIPILAVGLFLIFAGCMIRRKQGTIPPHQWIEARVLGVRPEETRTQDGHLGTCYYITSV